MDNSEITITIAAPAGAGKSLYAELIAQQLEKLGVRVSVQDENATRADAAARLQLLGPETLVRRPVLIQTQHTKTTSPVEIPVATPEEKLLGQLRWLFQCRRQDIRTEFEVTLSGLEQMREIQALVTEITGTHYEVPFAHVLDEGYFSVKYRDLNYHLNWHPVRPATAADVEAQVFTLLLGRGREGTRRTRITIGPVEAEDLRQLVASASQRPTLGFPFAFDTANGRVAVVHNVLMRERTLTWIPTKK